MLRVLPVQRRSRTFGLQHRSGRLVAITGAAGSLVVTIEILLNNNFEDFGGYSLHTAHRVVFDCGRNRLTSDNLIIYLYKIYKQSVETLFIKKQQNGIG